MHQEIQTQKQGSDIVEDCLEYETVGEHYICEVVDIREDERVKKQNKLIIEVDVPFGKRYWQFDKPYTWDGEFAEFAELHGYGQGNFHELLGDEVVVMPEDDDEKSWSLIKKTPHEVRKEVQDDEETEETQSFQEQYDAAIMFGIIMGSVFVVGGTSTGLMISSILVFLLFVYAGWRDGQ